LLQIEVYPLFHKAFLYFILTINISLAQLFFPN